MKRIISLLALILPVVVSAQNYSRYDVNHDGRVTVEDVTLVANAVLGKINYPVQSITLNKTTTTLTVGGSDNLKAIVAPADADNTEIVWSSSDESVATISSTGAITAIAPGKANIIATAADGSNVEAICKVTVNPIYVSSIYLSRSILTLTIGQSSTLTASVNPSNATDKTLEWTTSNTTVATVTDGVITTVAPGTCVITAKAADRGSVSATCVLTVNPIYISSITISETSKTIRLGDELLLTASVLPNDATSKELQWTSSDETIATVTDGKVTTVSGGSVTISVRAMDGSNVSASCALIVDDPLQNHKYVDLGLPSGTLWATCNIGASSPEEYGDYLAWGETSGYPNGKDPATYSTTYKYYSYGSYGSYKIKKYNTDSSMGTVDNKLYLDPADDVACQQWGEMWMMPTMAQLAELTNENYVTMEWTKLNGVNGVKFTSKTNGNSIFLPAAGTIAESGLAGQGEYGRYRSGELYKYMPNNAYDIYVGSSSSLLGVHYADRWYGFSVRPVVNTQEMHNYVNLALPSGTLWAKMNVGASKPEQVGDYFAWGETTPQTSMTYTWASYAHIQTGGTTWKDITKYTFRDLDYEEDGYDGRIWYTSNGDFVGDNKKTLMDEDDAAYVNCGIDWETPSSVQFYELVNTDYTTCEEITLNGVKGYKITSKTNRNYIFLPQSEAYRNGNKASSLPYFWTNQLSQNDSSRASAFPGSHLSQASMDRCYGMHIRPVRKK